MYIPTDDQKSTTGIYMEKCRFFYHSMDTIMDTLANLTSLKLKGTCCSISMIALQ